MAKATRNMTDTMRLQVSLDACSGKLLDQIAAYGFKGKNKSEVAARILQDWLLENAVAVLDEMDSLSDRVDNDEH